jgi:1,2-diacylglycerol 3-alpha-glucosyltransferase
MYTSKTGWGKINKVSTLKNTVMYNMARAFLANGNSVELVAGLDYKPTSDEVYEVPIHFFPLRFKAYLPNGFHVLGGLWSFLKHHGGDYDLIISSDVFSASSMTAAFLHPERLLIWHEPGKLHDRFCKIPARFWYNVPTRWFVKRRIPIIARSEAARLFISAYCNRVSPETIDHGIDLDIFKFSSEKEKYFIVIAQLIKRKQVDVILEKYAGFVNKYGRDYRLFIAGDGPEKEYLNDCVTKLGISDVTVFAGFLPQPVLADRLAHASGILMDSLHEFSMVSIPEAVVCGTPVLTNSIPYPASYVASDQLGIIKDGWGPDEIKTLIDNREFFTDNCLKRRPKMSNRYLAQHMIELYQSLLS